VNTVVITEGILPVHGSGFFHVLHTVAEQTDGGLGNVVVVDISVFELPDPEEFRAKAT